MLVKTGTKAKAIKTTNNKQKTITIKQKIRRY